MYYKITNQNSEIYKNLVELRQYEHQVDIDNLNEIKSRVGLEFDTYLGSSGQQNFFRTTQYNGFEFKDVDKVDKKIWSVHKEHSNIFVPNKKTKLGREMSKFLTHELKCSSLFSLQEILNLESLPSFKFPYVEVINDTVLLFIDDRYDIKNDDFIEITSKEFYETLNQNN